MGDDVKLQLGIDVEALKRSASDATNALTKAFAEQNIGANVLGSGVPASQLPQQAGSKDTIRGVIDALERIERTLTSGFVSLSGAAFGNGGAGGGGRGPDGRFLPGGGGGGGQPPPAPPPAAGGIAGMRGGVGRASDMVASMLPGYNNMWQGGFYGTDVFDTVNSAVKNIPIAGKIWGAVGDTVSQERHGNDRFKDMQYGMYRDAGKNSMDAMTNMWTEDRDGAGGPFENYTKRYGFTREDTDRLIRSSSRAGLTPGGKGMYGVMDMQGSLGLGEEAASAAGALQKAGGGGKEMDMFAAAIGVAVSSGLERGRWGEMLSMWQRAAQSSIDTDASLKDITAQQNGIASLGERFKGDSSAASSMASTLQGTTSNTGDALSMRNAMSLTGNDYYKATARMARSAQTPDAQLDEMAVNDVMTLDAVQKYMNSPSEDGLEDAAGNATNLHPGIPQLKFIDLLRKKKQLKGGNIFTGPSDSDMAKGRANIRQDNDQWNANVGTALGPGMSRTMKDRVQGSKLAGGAIQETGGGMDPSKGVDQANSALTNQSFYQQAVTQGSSQSSPFGTMSASGYQPMTATDSGGSGGLGDLSETDIRSAAESAGIPMSVMRSWFKTESGGDIQSRDSGRGLEDWRGARGYAQLTLEEAQSLGYTQADWVRMSTDKKLSLEASSKLAAKYYARAKQQAPAGWGQGDIQHLMKYQHGGAGFAKAGLDDYRKQHGGDAASWNDFYNAENGSDTLEGGYDKVQAHRALNNANKLEVSVVTDPTGHYQGAQVKTPGPSVVSSPTQLVGGKR